MPESRRGFALAQQSMRSSNLISGKKGNRRETRGAPRFSQAVVAKLLISRHAPCSNFLFLVQKFYFRLIPKNYRGYHWYSRKKAGNPQIAFSIREGHSVWCWFQDHAHLRSFSPCPMRPHPHRSVCSYFSISLSFRSNIGPSIFFSALFYKKSGRIPVLGRGPGRSLDWWKYECNFPASIIG